MSGPWGDLGARSAGLRTHLLPRAELEHLAAAGDLAAIARALGGEPGTPGELDARVRRRAADLLGTLERWSGDRAEVLSVLFEDEDRRSLRALVRGAIAGVPADVRAGGLIPTSSLPQRALGELAEESNLRQLAGRLAIWRSPYADVLLPEASQTRPDPFLVELAISRTYFERAARSARRDAHLAAYVRSLVDLENAYTVLLLRDAEDPRAAADSFLPGGAALDVEVQRAARDKPRELVLALLERALARSPLAGVFDPREAGDRTLEGRALAALIRSERRAALLDPNGTAPLISFALGLRASVMDLGLIIWGVALGAPRQTVERGLLS